MSSSSPPCAVKAEGGTEPEMGKLGGEASSGAPASADEPVSRTEGGPADGAAGAGGAGGAAGDATTTADVDDDSSDDELAKDSAVKRRLDGFLESQGLSAFSKKMAAQWLMRAMRGDEDLDHVQAWLLAELNHKRPTCVS